MPFLIHNILLIRAVCFFWTFSFITHVNQQIYIVSFTENDVRQWAEAISRDLINFTSVSSFSDQFHQIYQRAFDNNTIFYENIDPIELINSFSDSVVKKMLKIEDSLRNLSSILKTSYKESKIRPQLNESDIMNQRVFVENNNFPSTLKINPSVTQYVETDLNFSYIQIPTNYLYSNNIIEYEVRYSKIIDEEGMRIYQENDFIYQIKYGGIHGLLRIYPGRIFKKVDVADTFDTRRRNWFVKSVMPHKDVIFVIDGSGSMVGMRMAMANLISWIMLDLLNELDYVAIIYCYSVNSEQQLIFLGPKKGLIQANKQNIELLKASLFNYAQNFNPYGVCQAYLSISLAFETFNNLINKSCRKVIIVVTDGMEMDTAYNNITQFYNSDKQVSILTYQVGNTDTKVSGQMKILSSENNGCYQNIEKLSECWNIVENFYLVISYDNAVKMNEKITWSYSFQSFTTEALIISSSSALYNDYQGILSDAGLLGVAAVDMCLQQILNDLPTDLLHPGSYIFMTTINSVILFHPRLNTSQIKANPIQVTIKDFEFSTNSSLVDQLVESIKKKTISKISGPHLYIDAFNRTHVVNASYYAKNIDQFSIVFFLPELISNQYRIHFNLTDRSVNEMTESLKFYSFPIQMKKIKFLMDNIEISRCSDMNGFSKEQLINCSLNWNTTFCDMRIVIDIIFTINAINQIVASYYSFLRTNPKAINGELVDSVFIHTMIGASWSSVDNYNFQSAQYALTLASLHLYTEHYSLIISDTSNSNFSLSVPIYVNSSSIVGVTGINIAPNKLSSKIISSIPSAIALALNLNTTYFVIDKKLLIIDSRIKRMINTNLKENYPNIVEDLLRNNICKKYKIGTPYGSCGNCYLPTSSTLNLLKNWILFKSFYPSFIGYIISSIIITGRFYIPVFTDTYSCRYDMDVYECSLTNLNGYYEGKIGCSIYKIDYYIQSIPSTNMLLLIINDCESSPITTTKGDNNVCNLVETSIRQQEECGVVLKPPINQCQNQKI